MAESHSALYPFRTMLSHTGKLDGRRGPWSALFALLVLSVSLALGCVDSRPRPKHLILVTVDTWRADHFLSERAGTPLTPRLAELAAESVRFTQASSVGDETTPGVTGFLSGVIPHRSGVIINSNVLPPELPTLATLLRDAGFETRALVANPVLAPDYGFEKGFGSYRLLDRREGRTKVRARQLTDAALDLAGEWAARSGGGGERLFLWVHYLEPHGPYRPPREDRALFQVAAFGDRREVALLPKGNQSGLGGVPAYQQRGLRPVPRDVRDYLSRYAAEVHSLDRELGRLVDGLRRAGLLDDSLLILTSDHGEALENDHGYYFSHSNGMTVDQLHVPLMLRCSACPAGLSVDRPVSTVDILPTALDLLGVEVEVATDGLHLLDETPRVVVSQSLGEIAVRRGRWKAVWKRDEPPRLFDLASDPAEARDLSTERPEELRRLSELMREARSRPVIARAGLREKARKKAREALAALGYL